MKVSEPTFSATSKLARFIQKQYYQNNNRAKLTAFLESEESTKNGLSVNTLEIETENQIAANYALKFDEDRPVGISIHTINEYNNAATDIGFEIHEGTQFPWEHVEGETSAASYVHDRKKGNESHCLVRYTRLFDDLQQIKFARRMAYKPTYKIV